MFKSPQMRWGAKVGSLRHWRGHSKRTTTTRPTVASPKPTADKSPPSLAADDLVCNAKSASLSATVSRVGSRFAEDPPTRSPYSGERPTGRPRVPQELPDPLFLLISCGGRAASSMVQDALRSVRVIVSAPSL